MVKKHTVRVLEILRRDGLFQLAKSASTYAYNRYLFRPWIRLRVTLHTLKRRDGISRPFQPIMIDPDEIKFIFIGEFNQKIHIGSIKGGSWDKCRYPIQSNPVYQGLKQRFCENMEWSNTVYYKNAEENIRNHNSYLGYESICEFEERLAYVDDLYENIRDSGYRTQEQLADSDWDSNRHPLVTPAHRRTGEIGVNIARDGSILHNDGIHRLVIAKILDLPEVPVHIIVRHKTWQQIRDTIASDTASRSLRDRYTNHPDIQTVLFDETTNQ